MALNAFCILIKGMQMHVINCDRVQNSYVGLHKLCLHSACKNDCKCMYEINTR